MTTPGTPGIEKPMSERSAALRPISYQIDGLRTGRCGSPARRGLALVVFAPASAQQFDRQALAVLLEELVDAIGIGLDERTRLARHDREVERGRTCEPDGA